MFCNSYLHDFLLLLCLESNPNRRKWWNTRDYRSQVLFVSPPQRIPNCRLEWAREVVWLVQIGTWDSFLHRATLNELSRKGVPWNAENARKLFFVRCFSLSDYSFLHLKRKPLFSTASRVLPLYYAQLRSDKFNHESIRACFPQPGSNLD